MDFKNGVKNTQTAGYNGAHTVFFGNSHIIHGLPPKRWTSFMDKPRDCEAKAGGSF